MPAEERLAFTQLRKRPVVDAAGGPFGHLRDLVVQPGGPRPLVTRLLVVRPERDEVMVPWEATTPLSPHRAEPIRLSGPANTQAPARLRAHEILLGKSLLDKKVVDTARRRVVRVNDILLEQTEGGLAVTAVEVGLQSLLRSLGGEALPRWLGERLGIVVPRDIIPWDAVEPIETDLARARRQAVYTKLAKLHPADIADIVEDLDPIERKALLDALDQETAVEAITEAQPEVQASVIQMMEPTQAADVLEQMEPDEAADILSDLPEQKAQELLDTMEEEEAEEVAGLLEHEEDTAGGLMTTGFVAVPVTLRAAEAIQRIREEAAEAETISHVYVQDADLRLVGVLSLRELILADPSRGLAEVMTAEVISVAPETALREVAELLTKYNLLALPVVDAEGRLKGIVTVDDVLNLIVPMIWKKRAAKRFI